MGELHRDEGLQEIASAALVQGSFSFDLDELQSLINKWTDLADSYNVSITSAERMATITPPAYDMASRAHAKAANSSGSSYIDYLRHNAKYCEDQAQLFQSALNDYLGVEDTNATKIENSDREA